MSEQDPIRPVRTAATPIIYMICAVAFAADSRLSGDFLHSAFFEKMEALPTHGLKVKFKQGVRFLCAHNKMTPASCGDGEAITLAIGDSLDVSESHMSLEFRPLPNGEAVNGWLVEFSTDMRSFGGELTASYGVVLILDNSQVQFVEPPPGFDPALPPNDPTWEKIRQTISTSVPFSAHELFAQTATGKVTSQPFPKSTDAVVWRWKRADKNASNPLEARWIAENVEAVRQNRVITVTKSKPNQIEGEFTFTKPTAGFPPGKYRVEIWQAGETIYTEKFEISP